jgi:hypothetical protein
MANGKRNKVYQKKTLYKEEAGNSRGGGGQRPRLLEWDAVYPGRLHHGKEKGQGILPVMPYMPCRVMIMIIIKCSRQWLIGQSNVEWNEGSI